MSAGGDWWQRRGAATVGLTGWGSAQIRETKREKLLVEVEIPRHDRNMRGNEERKRGIPKPRKLSYIRTPGCQKKGTRQQKEEDQVPPPPTSPVLITNSQKWNAGPPCHQHCKATALEGAAGKCPTKGAKV